MTKKYFFLISTLYIAIICLSLIVINPQMFRNPWTASGPRPLPTPKYFRFRAKDLKINDLSLPVVPVPPRIGLKLGQTQNILDESMDSKHGKKSAPAVDETGIYEGSGKSGLMALNLDGKLKWKFEVDGSKVGIRGSPVLDHEAVYFGSENGVLYALRKSDGHLFWSLWLGAGIGASPLLDGPYLYAIAESAHEKNSFIAKIERKSGEVLWQSAWMGELSYSSPILDADQKRIYVGDQGGQLHALDSQSGQMLWTALTEGAIRSAATLWKDKLFFTSESGKLYALQSDFGKEIWKSDLGAPSSSTPVIASRKDLNMIIVGAGNGASFGIDALTGHIRWKYYSNSEKRVGSALITQNSHGVVAWLGCEMDQLCALDAFTGKLEKTYLLPQDLFDRPTAFGSSLYLALDDPGGIFVFSGK